MYFLFGVADIKKDSLIHQLYSTLYLKTPAPNSIKF